MELEGSLMCSQGPTIGPYLESDCLVHSIPSNILIFILLVSIHLCLDLQSDPFP
jgi:hypothetical protein